MLNTDTKNAKIFLRDIIMKNDIKIESKYLHDYNFINNPLVYGDVYLYQLGEIYCDNNAVVAPHVHDDFIEISYIFSGTGMMLKCY